MRVALLFDLFGVLMHKQSRADQHELAALAGIEPEIFTKAYWACRSEYDRGCPASNYWAAVARRLDTRWDEARIARLTEADNDSWSRVDDEMLELVRERHRQGIPCYLLSNIPRPLCRRLEAQQSWLGVLFERTFYSCDLGTAKPAAEAFARPIATIRREYPHRTIAFIDDNPDNIAAARAQGIAVHRFFDTGRLRRWLKSNWNSDRAVSDE